MRFTQTGRKRNRGSAIIEIALSFAALTIVALLSLRATVSATSTQTWTVRQAVSDAYISQESALASRVPFDTISANDSLWAAHPNVNTSTPTIGKLPGGRPMTATLHRTRVPDSNNLPPAGGSGNSNSNPSGTEAWKLQSILVYNINGREYMKSRTTLRIR